MFRRMISVCLILILSAAAGLSLPAGARASEDFTRWKQDDPAWNQEAAWSAEAYPDASRRTMAEGGSPVTSLAMLLRLYQMIPEGDIPGFNPWVCKTALEKAHAFNEKGELLWSCVEAAFPVLHFENRVEYSLYKLTGLLRPGRGL